MRAGITVSILGHAAILLLGLVAFSSSQPFEAAKIDALPVELVPIAELTDLLQGDKKAEELPKDEPPQPKPTVQAEAPAPAPAEEPAPEPLEATPPPAPSPPPEPALEPEPDPAEAAAPPEPAPADVIPPAPRATVPPALPRPRPDPPKQLAQPKPAPDQPKVAETEKKQPEFNVDDITALLNKQKPAGGGDPAPAQDPQTLGSIDGHTDAAMTQSEIEALKARLYQCWSPPVAVREASTLVVQVRITLLPDGSLSGQPTITAVAHASDPLAQVAAEWAIRAVNQCAPFGDILRPENYALWKEIDFTFDPRLMLGG